MELESPNIISSEQIQAASWFSWEWSADNTLRAFLKFRAGNFQRIFKIEKFIEYSL